jgi:hypothetical protein
LPKGGEGSIARERLRCGMECALFDELARIILKLEEGIDFSAHLHVTRARFIQKRGSLRARAFQRGFNQFGYFFCSFRPDH